MPDLAPLEIQALSKIIDELDYYQVLHLETQASAPEIKQAYYQSSRTFHPDANRHLPPDLHEQCERIAKRLTEAYAVLRDARRRKAYDEHIRSGGVQRMQLAEARAAHAKTESETRLGSTPQGRQFYQKAQQDLQAGNLDGAISNLQMALTFEPGCEGFKEQLEAVKKQKR